MRTAQRRTSYREVFAVAEYRVIALSKTLTLTAEALRPVALSVLILSATHSPLLAAMAFGLSFLPQALGGATLTTLADRVPARRLLIGFDLLQCLATAAMAATGIPVWGTLSILAGLATLAPLRSAVTGALVPEVLTGDRYVVGQSALQALSGGVQITGYAAGGLLLAVASPRVMLIVAAGCYALSASVWRGFMRERPARRRAAASLRAVATATWHANLRLLRTEKRIRGLLVVQWLPMVSVAGAEASLIAYAGQARLPAGSPGYLLAAIPAGMLAGNVVVSRLLRPVTRIRIALPLALSTGVPLLVFALVPGVWAALSLLIIVGASTAYLLPVQRAFAAAVPGDARGHAFGLAGTGLMTSQGAGALCAGVLASALTPASAMAITGGIGAAGVVLLRRSLTRRRLLVPEDDVPEMAVTCSGSKRPRLGRDT